MQWSWFCELATAINWIFWKKNRLFLNEKMWDSKLKSEWSDSARENEYFVQARNKQTKMQKKNICDWVLSMTYQASGAGYSTELSLIIMLRCFININQKLWVIFGRKLKCCCWCCVNGCSKLSCIYTHFKLKHLIWILSLWWWCLCHQIPN